MNPPELLKIIQTRFPAIQEIPKATGQARGSELYVAVPSNTLVEMCQFLRDEPALAFNSLSFLTSIDYKTYFELVYYIVSTSQKHAIVLKVRIDDRANPGVPSIAAVWPAADWQEREEFDLMGIRFNGHYNMRRILLPEDWEGHPLRKDYAAKADRYD